jgi:hypothetical protein
MRCNGLRRMVLPIFDLEGISYFAGYVCRSSMSGFASPGGDNGEAFDRD